MIKVLLSIILVVSCFACVMAVSTPNAFTLNGVSCYANVSIGVLDAKLVSTFSVEAWVKVTNFTTTYQGVAGTLVNLESGFGLIINGSNAAFVMVPTYNKIPLIAASQPLTADSWVHFAGVFNNNVSELYVNGSLVSTSNVLPVTNTSLYVDLTQDFGFLIGVYLTDLFDYYLSGEIDEVRIWSAALSAQTIVDYMYKQVDSSHPDYASLQGYYTFDSDSIYDNSSNANSGTAQGTCSYTPDCQLMGCGSGQTCNSTSGTCSIAYTCYGVPSWNQSVCSGQGSCVTQNVCYCNSGYTGSQCQNTICFGISSSNSTVCSGNGNCTLPGVCTCNTGYTGMTCANPVCFNISAAADTTVCSGAGNCVAPNTCNCFSGYSGANCSLKICGGITSDQPTVCNGHGTCFSPNLCNCNAGYAGSTCELSLCNGISSNDSSVCTSRGNCTAPNTCSCNSGYFGTFCELTTCDGIPSNSTTVCSGHGSCTFVDTCVCQPGFNGTFCSSAATCNGLQPSDPNVCFGNGVCNLNGTCTCKDSSYSGTFCSNHVSKNWVLNNFGTGINGIVTNYNILSSTGTTLVNCADYVDVSNPALGASASMLCYITGTGGVPVVAPNYNFQLLFGTGATLTVNGTINFFLSAIGQTGTTSIVIGSPLSPIAPNVLIEAPSMIGTCTTSFTLDGSGSNSADGRALTYAWTVDASVISAVTLPSGYANSSSFSFNPSPLPPGTYNFKLTISNFMGASSSQTVTLTKSNTDIPAISIQGGTLLTWRRSVANSVYATATLCGNTVNTSDITYAWSVSSSPAYVTIATPSSQYIAFNAEAMPPVQGTYIFQLTVTIKTSQASATQLITVNLVFDPVIAIIAGGDHSIPSTPGSLTLTSQSFDPEHLTTVTPSYTWTCAGISGSTCPSGLNFPNAAVVSYAGSLPSGSYSFTLLYAVGTRNSTTSVIITVVAPNLPIVSITSVMQSSYARASTIIASATSTGVSPVITWTITDQMEGNALNFATNGILLTNDGTTFSVVVYPNTLTEGVTYLFTATATTASGSTTANTTVFINQSPIPGTCSITDTTQTGTPVAGDLFKVVCSGWRSPSNLNFMYSFKADTHNGNGIVSLASPQQSNTVSLFLPAGPIGITTLWVYATDTVGSIGKASFNVTIGQAPPLNLTANLAATVSSSLSNLASLTPDQASQSLAILASQLPLATSGFDCSKSNCENNGTCPAGGGSCVCPSGYSGDDCSLDNTQLSALQDVVSTMLNAFASVVTCTGSNCPTLSSDAIDNQVSTLGAICASPAANTDSTQSKALNILNNLLSGSSQPSSYGPVATVLSNVAASAFGFSTTKLSTNSRRIYQATNTSTINTVQEANSNSALSVIEKILTGLTLGDIAGMPTSQLITNTLTMAAQRQSQNNLNSNLSYNITYGSSYTVITLSNSVETESLVVESNGATRPLNLTDLVDVQMTVFGGNPYAWANNAPNLTSNVVSMSLQTSDGSTIIVYNINQPISFSIPGTYDPTGWNDTSCDAKNVPTCMYWNVTSQSWASDGCKLVAINNFTAQCECNHLTSFAVHSIYTTFAANPLLPIAPINPILTSVSPNSTPLIICIIVAACYVVAFIIGLVFDYQIDPKFNTKTEKDRFGGWRRFNQAIRENHLWISTILRPNKNANYSRPQRITSLFTFILATIMFNAILYSTIGNQDMWAIGFASALLGLVIPNVLGWLFSHIGLQRNEAPPVTIATPVHLAVNEEFENEEYGNQIIPEPTENGIPRPKVSSPLSAVLKEGAEQKLADQLEPQDKKKKTPVAAPKQEEVPKEEATPESIKQDSIVASKIQVRVEQREHRAKVRASELSDLDVQNKSVPLSTRWRHFNEALNDRMDSVFDAIELQLDKINCTFRTVSFGMIATTLLGILLYYICCGLIIVPLAVRLQVAFPYYLIVLFFLMATLYLIMGIEFMYFKHKRAHWNEWAEWSISKVVIALYSIAIAVTTILWVGMLIGMLAGQFWKSNDALGYVLVVFFPLGLFDMVLIGHLTTYLAMKPRGEENTKKHKFNKKFELPSWSVYIVYAFAYVYMIAALAVTISLGYTKFDNQTIANNWLLAGLISMFFDIIVIRPVGVIALSFFAKTISRFIKASCFDAPMISAKEKVLKAPSKDVETVTVNAQDAPAQVAPIDAA